jgi:DNA polymerase-3 subunit gamma/tau
MRMIEALGDTLSRTKRGGDPKLELELTFLKLARDYVEPSVDVLLGRLEMLEKAVADRAAAPPAPPREKKVEFEIAEQEGEELVGEAGSKKDVEMPGEAKPEEDLVDEQAESVELITLVAQWSQVMQDLKKRKQASAEAVFRMARPAAFYDNVLELDFPAEHEYFLDLAGYAKHVSELQKVLEERLGIRPRLEFRVVGSDGATPEGAAKVGVPPARSQSPQEGLETAPEAEPLYGEGAEDAGAMLDTDSSPDKEAAREARADDTIQDPREVFTIARERFGIDDSSSIQHGGS